jgi:hypothetical protein
VVRSTHARVVTDAVPGAEDPGEPGSSAAVGDQPDPARTSSAQSSATFTEATRWDVLRHRLATLVRSALAHAGPLRRAARGLALAAILAGAWVLARLPHTDLGITGAYPYPRHMDEWVHWGRAAATYRQGTVAFASPWTGAGTGGSAFRGVPFYHEIGFNAYNAVLHKVTGLPFLTVFEYGAAATFLVLVLGAYAVGRRHGYGLEAAAFAALVPTTPRFLGPAFHVPITFSFVVFIPAALVAWRRRSRAAVPLLFLLVATVWTLHARAALFLTLPVLLGAAARWRDDRVLAVGIAAAVLVPLAVVTPVLYEQALSQTSDKHPIDRTVFEGFGLATLALFALGTGWAVADLQRSKEDGSGGTPPTGSRRVEPAILAVSALVALALVFARPMFGIQPAGMYDRAHMLYFFTAAPVAGYGLMKLRNLGTGFPALGDLGLGSSDDAEPGRGARIAWPRVATLFGVLLGASLAVAAVGGAVATQMDQPYYAVIGDEDWEAWEWMERELPAREDHVLMVPWKGLAFGATSERTVLEHQNPGQDVSVDSLSVRVALRGEAPMDELRGRGVDVLYTQQASFEHDGLERVHRGVYVVQDGG